MDRPADFTLSNEAILANTIEVGDLVIVDDQVLMVDLVVWQTDPPRVLLSLSDSIVSNKSAEIYPTNSVTRVRIATTGPGWT